MQTEIKKNGYPVAVADVEENEEINLRKIFVIALKHWHLFVIFSLLGIECGYLAVRYSEPSYKAEASIYVLPKKTGVGSNLDDLFSSQLSGNKAEVYNQIEILKSFSINDQVALNLNWRTSWYLKDRLTFSNLFTSNNFFSWKACYNQEPFHVEEIPGAYNSSGVELHLHPLNARQYTLEIEEVVDKGIKKPYRQQITGTYGEPINNKYFNFTITPTGRNNIDFNHLYYFTFNNPSSVARSQLAALQVDLNDKNSEIIRMQIQGKQPDMQIDYLNELINVYMQNKLNFQTETQKRSLAFIDSQLVGISDSLNTAGSNFTEFRSRNNIFNIGEQGSQVMTNLMQIESERNKNQMQLDYFRNLLDYLGKSDDMKQLVAPSVVGIQDPALNTLVVKLSELYSRRQILSFSANETNPTLLMIDKEIDQTNARLKENLRNLIQNAEVLNSSLDNQKSDISAQLNRLPAKEQDLIHYQRRYELTNEIYTFLLQKRSEINIALAGATPEVQVIDAARMETTSVIGFSSMSKMMMGLMLGLIIPAVYLLVFNFFSTTIQTQEDIQYSTHLPILGNVIHSRTQSDTPVNDNPQSGIAESYRSIRTNLQFVLNGSEKKVVAIHSTNPGEGKSFTSVNLSSILAMNDKKVVLIGADMRKARLHKIFNLPNDKGLSTYLSGQVSLKEIIHECNIDNLMVIPSGPVPPNPSELIDRPAMKLLLDKLSKKFDYIILDNAPVSLVTDGLLAGRLADLNIFILRYGFSKKDQIKHINQIADKKLLSNITLVVNDIQGPGFGYGENYYYNKYYENGKGYYIRDDEVEKKVRLITTFSSLNNLKDEAKKNIMVRLGRKKQEVNGLVKKEP